MRRPLTNGTGRLLRGDRYNARMRLPVACATMMAVAASLSGDAPAHFVARVSDEGALRPAEASIAINPANSDHLVAVSLQAMKPGSAVRVSNVSYTSFDGGRTWRTVAAPNDHQRVHGDDAVTI